MPPPALPLKRGNEAVALVPNLACCVAIDTLAPLVSPPPAVSVHAVPKAPLRAVVAVKPHQPPQQAVAQVPLVVQAVSISLPGPSKVRQSVCFSSSPNSVLAEAAASICFL